MSTNCPTCGSADPANRLYTNPPGPDFGMACPNDWHSPEPRTWAFPPEPGPEVKAVRDRDGAVWRRAEGGWALHWLPMTWAHVLGFGPLTDATAEVAEGGAG